MQSFRAFAKQLLVSGVFKVTEFPTKTYRELVMQLEQKGQNRPLYFESNWRQEETLEYWR